jgi:hypothetical protein
MMAIKSNRARNHHSKSHCRCRSVDEHDGKVTKLVHMHKKCT